MNHPRPNPDPDALDLHTALRQRLRFENALGIQSVRPVPLRMRTPEPSDPPEPPEPSTLGEAPVAASDSAGAPLFGAEALSAKEKARRWEELEARALACTKCPLHRGRAHVVFGEGSRDADLVFVGEGPGADEDRTGRPFVGRAGQLLDKIIGAMGFAREAVYIANVIKCRPPGNRTPSAEESALCGPYLEEQLELLQPKVIVALGSPAAKTLLKTTQGITALRGRWRLYHGVRVMPTFHPAFLLRQYTPGNRRKVWDDMRQVIAYLKEH